MSSLAFTLNINNRGYQKPTSINSDSVPSTFSLTFANAPANDKKARPSDGDDDTASYKEHILGKKRKKKTKRDAVAPVSWTSLVETATTAVDTNRKKKKAEASDFVENNFDLSSYSSVANDKKKKSKHAHYSTSTVDISTSHGSFECPELDQFTDRHKSPKKKSKKHKKEQDGAQIVDNDLMNSSLKTSDCNFYINELEKSNKLYNICNDADVPEYLNIKKKKKTKRDIDILDLDEGVKVSKKCMEDKDSGSIRRGEAPERLKKAKKKKHRDVGLQCSELFVKNKIKSGESHEWENSVDPGFKKHKEVKYKNSPSPQTDAKDFYTDETSRKKKGLKHKVKVRDTLSFSGASVEPIPEPENAKKKKRKSFASISIDESDYQVYVDSDVPKPKKKKKRVKENDIIDISVEETEGGFEGKKCTADVIEGRRKKQRQDVDAVIDMVEDKYGISLQKKNKKKKRKSNALQENEQTDATEEVDEGFAAGTVTEDVSKIEVEDSCKMQANTDLFTDNSRKKENTFKKRLSDTPADESFTLVKVKEYYSSDDESAKSPIPKTEDLSSCSENEHLDDAEEDLEAVNKASIKVNAPSRGNCKSGSFPAIEISDNQDDSDKLRSLHVNLPFPVPPVHVILTGISLPKKGQLQKLKKANIPVKTGPFSTAEDELIIQNWKQFCKEYDLSMNAAPFIKFPIRMNPITKLNIVRYLAHGLDDRPLNRVYIRFRMLCKKHRIKVGRFSKEEDKAILDYMDTTNSTRPFRDLAELLNRTCLSVEKRYDRLREAYTEKFSVTLPVAEKFINKLMKIAHCGDVNELKDKKFTMKEWRKLSRKMDGVPVIKLQQAWTLKIYPRLFSKETDVRKVKLRLMRILWERNETDWRTVNWKEIAKHFKGFTPQKLYTMIKQLAVFHVPKDKHGSLKECLEFLKVKIKSYRQLPYTCKFKKIRLRQRAFRL
ncbi:hypothetical protein NQ315_006412 [Exocentrus adspersus]|uniref:Uncharacterized protein n=1 Tax=Exocentrus adspersus TaxID=1586481 RepID=A0AAV8W001_9CUCU|nr:hypothetical protein NQ315_006412 [Exocentrus adspersus]